MPPGTLSGTIYSDGSILTCVVLAVDYKAADLETKLAQPAVPEEFREVKTTVNLVAEDRRTAVTSPPHQLKERQTIRRHPFDTG